MNRAAGIVIIAPGNRVLYMLRDDGGGWGIPGGKAESGEGFQDAAVRETFEETGMMLDAAALRPIAIVQNNDGFEFAAFAINVPLEFIPRMTEHTAAVWATPAEAPLPQFLNNAEIVGQAVGTPVADRADIDANGWVTYPDNPISKEGVFPYLGKTLIAAGFPGLDPDTAYPVYRPGEELARQETIDSFKLVPWIINHTHLGEGAADTDRTGIGGIVGEQVYYRDGVLYGNLKVFGNAQKQAIYKDGLKELSIGYTAKFDRTPGMWQGESYEFIQRGIMGNHLASVRDGRSGPDIRVFDAKEIAMDEETKARLDKLDMQIGELMALVKAKVEKDAKAADEGEGGEGEGGEKKPDETKAADEGEGGEKKPDETKAADEGEETIAAKVEDALPRALAALRRRDALATQVAQRVGVFDHADMTEKQVAEYAAKKMGVEFAATPDTLRAYLHGLGQQHAASAVKIGDSGNDTPAVPKFLHGIVSRN